MARPIQGNGTRRSSSGNRNSTSDSRTEVLKLDEFGVIQVPPVAPGFAELLPTRFEDTKFRVSMLQHMGDRRTQEDRFCIVPILDKKASEPESPAFFGVYDGTVGDFASDNVKDIVVPTLLEREEWKNYRTNSSLSQGDKEALLKEAMTNTYLLSDKKLLERCSRHQQHYATCTSVTVLMTRDYLAVSHLGDSRIVIGRQDGGKLVGEQATLDHKPDLDDERKRIEECGGMVERLINHNNKPFIRGGDFMMRKALGEQPMQLQYSRAFGGKDLKIFGLSSNPTVKVLPRVPQMKWIILASDGLWDIVSSQQAVDIAQEALDQQHNPSAALVRAALLEQSRRKGRADNITVVCVQLLDS
jgi:protein phosphatase